MKLEEWGSIIVSWANFLDPNEEISSLKDLSESDLFTRLLRVLRNSSYQGSSSGNELCFFLQEQYPSLDLDELHAENNQGTILRATAFLIYCSLHHEENELQKKMTELPHWTQLCLTDFLQEFVSVPNTDITQALIFSEISKIQSSRIPGSLRNSPNFGTPILYTSSPSTGDNSKTLSSSKKTSRVRKLRKEVEMLNNVKAELSEELEAAKETISKLEATVQKKDQDINRLKHQLQNVDSKEEICEVILNKSNENVKSEKLKALIEKLEQDKLALEDELLTAEEEKKTVYEELKKMKSELQNAEIQCKIFENDKAELENQITSIQMALEQLTITNKEQSDYIAELTKPKDNSKIFSDSQNESLILPETLGQHVIDLEIRELKEIIENKENLMKAQEDEIHEKLAIIDSLKLNLKESEEKYELMVIDFNSKEGSLLNEIETKSAENNELKKENSDLLCQCSDLSVKVKRLEEEIDCKESMISQITCEKKVIETEFANAHEQYKIELRTKDLLISELKSLKEKLDDDIKIKTKDIVELKEKLSFSNEQLQLQENKVLELKQWSTELSEKKNNELKAKSEQMNELYQTMTNQLKQLELIIKEKSNDIRNCEAIIKNLESKNSLLTKTVQEKDSIIVSLQNSLDSINEDVIILKSNQNSLSSELQAKISYICQLQKELDSFKSVVVDNYVEKESLLKLIAEKEKALEQSLIRLDEVQTDFESKIQSFKRQLEDKNKLCVSMEQDVIHLQQCLSESSQQLEALENEIKEKQETILSNGSEIEKLKSEIISYKEMENEMSTKLSIYQEKINNMENDLVSRNTLICDLEGRINSAVSQYNNILVEKQNLDDIVSKNVETIKVLEFKLAEKEQEMIKNEQLKSRELLEFNNTIEDLKSILCKSNSELEELKLKNNSLNNELTHKALQITNYESDIKSYQTENNLLKEENQLLLKEISSKENVLIDLQDIIKKNETEKSSLMRENSKHYLEIETLVEKCESLVKQIEYLQKEVTDYKENDILLTAKVKDKENTILKLEEIVKELKDSLNSNEIKCGELEKDIATLKDLKCSYESNVANLQSALEEKDSSLNSHKLLINDLNEEITLLQRDQSKLKECLILKESEIHELKQDNSSLKKEIEVEKLERKKMVLNVEEMKRELQDYLCSITTLKDKTLAETTVLNKEIENYKALVDDLVNEKELLKTEIDNVMTEKEMISIKLKEIEQEHFSCGEKAQFSESVIHELKDKESILKEELYKSNEREVSLKSELNNKNTVISQLNDEMKNLKKSLADHEFDEEILSTKLQAKEAEVNKMLLEVNAIKKRLKEKEDLHEEETQMHLKKIHDLDTTIGLMNNQFIKINLEKESLITELQNKKTIEKDLKVLQHENESLIKNKEEFEKMLEFKNNEISQLQDKLSSLESASQEQKKKNSELCSFIETQNIELNSLEKTIEILKSDISQNSSKETDLLAEISSKNNLIDKLKQKLEELEKFSEEVDSELKSLKDTVQNKDILLEKYAKENNVLMLDLDLHLKKEEVLNSQLETKIKEIEDIRTQFKQAEEEVSQMKLKCSDQEQTIKGLYATLQSQNSELKEKNEEIILLQEEIKKANQQLADSLSKPKQNERTQADGEETGSVKSASGPTYTKEEVDIYIAQVKANYEKKAESYKAALKKRFAEKLEDLTYTLQNENTDLKEKFLKEQERCAKLQSELWNASDKLLITQEQNRTLLTKLQSRNAFEVLRPSEPLSPISKARSMEVLSGRNRGIDNFARDIDFNESGCSSRRSSIRSLPRGMGKKFSFSAGKVFPAAEEDGEVFDNRYLADLKAGICNVQYDPDRVSTLQYRNSLCPPHLKSSYPLETQFVSCEIKEDDIKSGTRIPSSSSETDVRKTKVQSSYKKPGPPTPSRNGGHSYSQGSERGCQMTPKFSQKSNGKEGVVNESFVLRESNSRQPENPSRTTKMSTPSRIKALFSHKRDENSPRRKSLFMRRN